MTPDPDPYSVALSVVRALDALGVQSTIGGSIASSFAGKPRATIDIDIVAALEEGHVCALAQALSPEFYADEGALRRAVQDRSSANLIHQATMLKVDLFVAGGTPLDAQQIARRLRVSVGEGRELYVHPPEDILLQKLRWYRFGGQTAMINAAIHRLWVSSAPKNFPGALMNAAGEVSASVKASRRAAKNVGHSDPGGRPHLN